LRRFRGFDWNALMHKKLQAPIVPHAQSEDDTSYFDEYPEEVPAWPTSPARLSCLRAPVESSGVVLSTDGRPLELRGC
jgi:hypothetical protein